MLNFFSHSVRGLLGSWYKYFGLKPKHFGSYVVRLWISFKALFYLVSLYSVLARKDLGELSHYWQVMVDILVPVDTPEDEVSSLLLPSWPPLMLPWLEGCGVPC